MCDEQECRYAENRDARNPHCTSTCSQTATFTCRSSVLLICTGGQLSQHRDYGEITGGSESSGICTSKHHRACKSSLLLWLRFLAWPTTQLAILPRGSSLALRLRRATADRTETNQINIVNRAFHSSNNNLARWDISRRKLQFARISQLYTWQTLGNLAQSGLYSCRANGIEPFRASLMGKDSAHSFPMPNGLDLTPSSATASFRVLVGSNVPATSSSAS